MHGDAVLIQAHEERTMRAADGRVVGNVRVAVLAPDREPAGEMGVRSVFCGEHAWKRGCQQSRARASRVEQHWKNKSVSRGNALLSRHQGFNHGLGVAHGKVEVVRHDAGDARSDGTRMRIILQQFK